MIFDLFSDGLSFDLFDLFDLIVNLLVRVFIIFCVLPIHEFAHAYTAYKLGDDTARLSGRMTANPLAHIDPFGAIMIIFLGFGWAKPVPVNIRRFRNRKAYMAITAFAGPVSNIIMAFLFAFASCLIKRFVPFDVDSFVYYIYIFLLGAFEINITLAAFNLLPIPPLDGSRLLSVILPNKYYYKVMQYERYSVFAIIALSVFGVLNVLIGLISEPLSSFVYFIASWPFKFI